jgi:hypothetical protein
MCLPAFTLPGSPASQNAHDPTTELILLSMAVTRLCNSCLPYLARLVQTEPGNEQLYQEYARLKLWMSECCIDNGKLDDTLTHSQYLTEPTIDLLLELAGCLLWGFKYRKNRTPAQHHKMRRSRWLTCHFLGPSEADRSQLRASLLEISESQAISSNDEDEENSNDDNNSSTGSHVSVIQELHDILDSLYELSPALNRASCKSLVLSRKEPVSLGTFCNSIHNIFPEAPSYLVERFAENTKKSWKTIFKCCPERKQEASQPRFG